MAKTEVSDHFTRVAFQVMWLGQVNHFTRVALQDTVWLGEVSDCFKSLALQDAWLGQR